MLCQKYKSWSAILTFAWFESIFDSMKLEAYQNVDLLARWWGEVYLKRKSVRRHGSCRIENWPNFTVFVCCPRKKTCSDYKSAAWGWGTSSHSLNWTATVDISSMYTFAHISALQVYVPLFKYAHTHTNVCARTYAHSIHSIGGIKTYISTCEGPCRKQKMWALSTYYNCCFSAWRERTK